MTTSQAQPQISISKPSIKSLLIELRFNDYGIPETVLDRRAVMEGRQRKQLRGAGALIEKLATLTRPESRVAYEWMNNDDPQAADHFEQQLPEESVKTMACLLRPASPGMPESPDRYRAAYSHADLRR